MKGAELPPWGLLRLVRALEGGWLPDSARRRTAGAGRAERPEPFPKSTWRRLESLRARFQKELAFADSLLADDPPRFRVRMLLANSSELRRVAILQRFVERAYSLRLHHPRQGLQLAGDLIAWTQRDRSPLVAVLRARASMERGNFLRILGDAEGAYEALSRAASELEANGSGDPLEAARYQELLGTLERDCGRFDAAARLLKKALAKVRRWGDPLSLQRVLMATALNDVRRGRLEEADARLDESLSIERPDSLFLRYAVLNKVVVQVLAGRPHRAYRTLLRVRDGLGPSWLRGFPRAQQMGVLWNEAHILNDLHLHDEAISRLKQAREFFIQASQGSKVAHVSVELVRSHAAGERYEDVRRELALGLRFCCGRSPLDRHAREALLLLQGALADQGRLHPETVRAVNHRLDLLHQAPLKAWDPPLFAGLRL